MIPFFRKIRKNMIDDNSSQGRQVGSFKYLKYAAGEVALVVIGILIALQINNWNEERKNRVLLHTYIESISEDIKLDLLSFDSTIRTLRTQVEAGDEIIPIMESEQRLISDSLKFILDFNRFTSTSKVPDRNTTWDFLNSSGVISDFPDTKLLKLLQDYYRNYAQLISNHETSAIPARLELRQLKYELFKDKEHKKFFPTRSPKAPGNEVYDAIFNDKRVLPLCRYIGSTAIFFEDRFNTLHGKASNIIDYIDTHF